MSRFLSWLLSFLLVFSGVVGLPLPVWAQAMPTTEMTVAEGKTAAVPDPTQLSFSQLPPIESNGGFSEGSTRRTWQVGQTPDQYLTLGDIESLRPQDLTLQSIGQITNQNLEQAGLAGFAPVAQQNVGELLEVAPSLGQLKLDQLPPIQTLFGERAAGIVDKALPGGTSLLQAIQKFPDLAQLDLNAIDLQKFAISTLPGISQVPLGQFPGSDSVPINGVPGLGQVPLKAFPNPLSPDGSTVMRIDMVYSTAEAERTHTISGSKEMGFQVPCKKQGGVKDCAYIELDDLENSGRDQRGPLEGSQWISGKYQEVEGGSGLLKLINKGKEPTGRLPFGDVFKVVIWEPDEKTDNVTTALFTRFCKSKNNCTPYFIGPIPFLSYKRDSTIFVGALSGGGSSSKPSTPTGAKKGGAMPGIRTGGLPINTQCLTAQAQALAQQAAGKDGGKVIAQQLAKSVATAEGKTGDYQTAGAFACVEGESCGRDLGRYQLSPNDPTVKSLITAKPGGAQFLEQVSQGKEPTPSQLMQFLPPADQDKALQTSLQSLADQAKQEIDPKTGQPFSGDRLVERTAQKYLGGTATPVDAIASVGTSPKEMAQKAVTSYQQQVGSAGAGTGIEQVCSNSSGGGSGQTCKVDLSKLDGATKSVIGALDPNSQEGAPNMVPYILQECGKAGITDSDQLAYILATGEHETDHFRTMAEYDQTPYDACGAGEGMIQVTWCDGKQKVFEKLGLPAYGGVSDKRLQEPTVAAQALCRGMKEGWFGQQRPIAECIGGGKVDYLCARQQVNSNDRYEEIGAKADRIRAGLAGGGAGAKPGISSAVTCTTSSGGGGNGSPPPKGEVNQKVMQSVNQRGSFSSAEGPSGGNEACAWAVNQVLAQSGISPLGENPNYVPSVEAALQGGRGQQINQSQAQAGDIVIAPGQAHIGICMDTGCNTVRSNSSSNASFTWNSGFNFDGWYDKYGGSSNVYRITQP